MKSGEAPARTGGFTLIELLIVIAIIAILAAILFPVFATAREKARQTSCLNNMKQIGLALTQYTNDYDGFFPVGSAGNCAGTAGSMDWIDESLPYVKDRNLFLCPDDPLSWPQTFPNSVSDFPGLGNVFTSYKANGCYTSGGAYNIPLGIMVSLSDVNGPYKSLALSQIGRPDQSIAIAEQEEVPMPWLSTLPNANIYADAVCHQTQALFEGNQNTVSAIPNGTVAWTANGIYDYSGPNGGVTAVHSGLANFIFCDGHVKSMAPYLTCPLGTSKPSDASNMWNVTRP